MLTAEANGRTITISDDERQPCEVWTRVMGYYRTTADMNHGKLSEHRERRLFMLPNDVK